AQCPAGEKVIGTGATPTGAAAPNIEIRQVIPTHDLQHVLVNGAEDEPTNGPWGVIAYAICAKVAS
ncbi:MAG TPA: hypothetical protein VF715_15230, partial [Thermoleophilaceae bacterium]